MCCLSAVTFGGPNSALSDPRRASPGLFRLLFAWYIFPTLSLPTSPRFYSEGHSLQTAYLWMLWVLPAHAHKLRLLTGVCGSLTLKGICLRDLRLPFWRLFFTTCGFVFVRSGCGACDLSRPPSFVLNMYFLVSHLNVFLLLLCLYF